MILGRVQEGGELNFQKFSQTIKIVKDKMKVLY